MIRKTSEAYDLSLFEAKNQNKLKNNILKLPQKRLKSDVKKGFDLQTAIFFSLMTCIAVGVCTSLIKNQVELSELTSHIYNKNKEIEQEKNEETSIRIKLESNLSSRDIKEYSKNVLRMHEATPEQIEYIFTKVENKAEILK